MFLYFDGISISVAVAKLVAQTRRRLHWEGYAGKHRIRSEFRKGWFCMLYMLIRRVGVHATILSGLGAAACSSASDVSPTAPVESTSTEPQAQPAAPVVADAAPYLMPADARVHQHSALGALELKHLKFSRLGAVSDIIGNTGVVASQRLVAAKKDQDGAELLAQLKDFLLATGTETLTLRTNRPLLNGTYQT